MTAPVGESSAPPSADQPKHLRTPFGSKRALGVVSMALNNRVWCNPGKGTPSAPRNALAPLTIVRKAPVNMEDILTNEPHLTRNRTSLKSKLSRIVENQAAFNPKPDQAGRINVSGSKSIVFDAEQQSAKGRNSKSVSRNFFLILSSSATVFLPFNRLLEKPETSAPVFPPSPVRLRRGERADLLSQFTRAIGGDVILNRKKHTTGVHLFAGSKALKTHTCTALLDTGSPAFFIQEKVWLLSLIHI